MLKAIVSTVVLTALLFTSEGVALERAEFAYKGWVYSLEIPPRRYQSGAFLAPPKVIEMNAGQVDFICNGDGRYAGGTWGCASVMSTVCPIVIEKGLPFYVRTIVLLHEEGHCRGWPADHPE